MMRRKGQALILDAMVFLTVAAVVSVSLIVARTMPNEGKDDLQHLTDDIHDVLLRTTVDMTDRPSGDSISAYDLAISYALRSERGDDLAIFDGSLREITTLLDAMTPENADWSWSMEFNGTYVCIGNLPRNDAEVWVSERRGQLPLLGVALILHLQVWR